MINTERVTVSLHLEDQKYEVGELVQDRNKIFFQFYPDFIDIGLEISPFKLPLSSGIHQAETDIFNGLFGVFHDSLPDGWGRLLLDRSLIAKGIPSNSLA